MNLPTLEWQGHFQARATPVAAVDSFERLHQLCAVAVCRLLLQSQFVLAIVCRIQVQQHHKAACEILLLSLLGPRSGTVIERDYYLAVSEGAEGKLFIRT